MRQSFIDEAFVLVRKRVFFRKKTQRIDTGRIPFEWPLIEGYFSYIKCVLLMKFCEAIRQKKTSKEAQSNSGSHYGLTLYTFLLLKISITKSELCLSTFPKAWVEFSKTLGGPLTLGWIFQNPGWSFLPPSRRCSCCTLFCLHFKTYAEK